MKKKIFSIIGIVVLGRLLYPFKSVILLVFTNFFSNLDKPINASMYTLLITLISVILTYYVTIRHDRNKYERERFQVLYMPIVNRIIAYYKVKTHWRRGHDVCDNVSETDIQKFIINHIETNIKYASSRLISEYMRIDSYNYIEDFKGDMEEIDFLYFCKIILYDIIRLNNKCKIFDSNLKKTIICYYYYYTIYSIVANSINDDQKATSFISWQWQFKKISRVKYYKINLRYKMLCILKKKEKILDYLISVVAKSEDDKKIYMDILNGH